MDELGTRAEYPQRELLLSRILVHFQRLNQAREDLVVDLALLLAALVRLVGVRFLFARIPPAVAKADTSSGAGTKREEEVMCNIRGTVLGRVI